MLVLSSEMPGSCVLDSVQLLCGSGEYNHGVFLNAGIYACHTTVTELDSACAENYDGNEPVQVMTRDTLNLLWTNGEWQSLGFDGPFRYNGSDNLVLEFRWQGDDGGSVYNLGYYTSANRAVDARSSTAEYGTPRNYMPRLRIHYSPTDIGEDEPLMASGEVIALPNPFRASVRLSGLGTGGSEATIYSATGCLVRALRASPGAGRRSPVLRWDGRDAAGFRVRPGAYFCRLGDGRSVRLARVD